MQEDRLNVADREHEGGEAAGPDAGAGGDGDWGSGDVSHKTFAHAGGDARPETGKTVPLTSDDGGAWGGGHGAHSSTLQGGGAAAPQRPIWSSLQHIREMSQAQVRQWLDRHLQVASVASCSSSSTAAAAAAATSTSSSSSSSSFSSSSSSFFSSSRPALNAAASEDEVDDIVALSELDGMDVAELCLLGRRHPQDLLAVLREVFVYKTVDEKISYTGIPYMGRR